MNEYTLTFTKEELDNIVCCVESFIYNRCIGDEGKDLEELIEKINNRIESIERNERYEI